MLIEQKNRLILPYFVSLKGVKKCPYSEFFWSLFSRIRTEYGDLRNKSPYSVQIRENKDQKNSEYRHFLHSVTLFMAAYHGKITFSHCFNKVSPTNKKNLKTDFIDINILDLSINKTAVLTKGQS